MRTMGWLRASIGRLERWTSRVDEAVRQDALATVRQVEQLERRIAMLERQLRELDGRPEPPNDAN